MAIFITTNNSYVYLYVTLICICYQEPRCLKISTFSYMYFIFFWRTVSFLSINLICDFACIYGQAKLWCYNCHIFYCFYRMSHCKSQNYHIICMREALPFSYWTLFLLGLFPQCYTFLHTYIKQEFDNASPCPSLTTISKQSDIFPWIFHSDNRIFHYHLEQCN